MPTQSDFPPKWTCETPQKSAKFEVRVPDESLADLANEHGEGLALALAQSRSPGDYTWIEIPVVEAELYVEKGDAAQVQRTAKVKFPTTWGRNTDDVLHNSPRQLITRFDHRRSEQFMFARLSFKRPSDDEYVLSHFGWVGGIGQSGQGGVSKLWIYDVAEMLEGAFVGTTFNHPTVKGAAERLARLINDNTPVPVTDVYIVHPDTEAEFEETLDAIIEEGLGGGKPATNYHFIAAQAEASPKGVGQNFSAKRIDTGPNLPVANLDTKTFEPNHDTLRDVVEWFERKTSAKVHFEPSPSGDSVVLVADVIPERRTWTQREVLQQRRENRDAFPNYTTHGIVDVIKNNALYEIKPFNTLYLRGDTSFSSRDVGISGAIAGVRSLFYGMETEAAPSKVYPSVKVQVPALVQAAEGVELAPELMESDAESLDAAEQEAISELRKLLEEETEGSIKILGHPQVMPFDRIDSFEACGPHIEFEETAASYEVESVKHKTSGGDIYTSRITVSVWANDDTIEVVESKMEDADG